MTSGGMGTMGYSIPAAVGTAMAQRDMGIKTPIFAVCGDGSFQMSLMELATIKGNELPVKIVLFVNNRLGMVRELQDKLYEERKIGVFLDGSPDFVKLVESYGIKAMQLDASVSDPKQVLEEFVAYEGACLLQVSVSPGESTL